MKWRVAIGTLVVTSFGLWAADNVGLTETWVSRGQGPMCAALAPRGEWLLPLLLVSLPPLIAGALLVVRLWPSQRWSASRFLLKGILAMAWGIGASSCVYFVTLILWRAPRLAVMGSDLVFFLVLTSGLFFAGRYRRRLPMLASPPATVVPNRLYSILVSVFAILLVSSLAQFIALCVQAPHGQWDAWAMWNLRAKYLCRGGDHWADGFRPVLPHADYPLLLPASVARAWKTIGCQTALVPALLALAFSGGTVALLVSALAILRSKSQGVLAGLLLLGTPFFITLGASQYADTPLGFYFLATLALICLHRQTLGEGRGLLVLAGVMAGFAAWTKNEGLLFLVVLIVAHMITTVPERGWTLYRREATALLVGFAPVALCLVGFKGWLAASNDLFADQGWKTLLERLQNGSRYVQVGQALLRHHQIIGPLLIGVLLMYRLLLGRAPQFARPNASSLCLLVIGGMSLGYLAIYLITHNNLGWHLQTSMGRLMMQLWPAAVLTYCLRTATPEEALVCVRTGFWSHAFRRKPFSGSTETSGERAGSCQGHDVETAA